ncbi:MAG TPA: hypothetical protein VLW83_16590, partial [Candidatus Acidoferrales bacterium]|nr:hypothetical protein [Candidatus Acidoferrales bacterium]
MMKTPETVATHKRSKRLAAITALTAGIVCLGGTSRSSPAPVPPVLAAMKAELDRSITTLG